jgi:uracil-DNA glycosylase family 4
MLTEEIQFDEDNREFGVINRFDNRNEVNVCHTCPLALKYGGCDKIDFNPIEIVGKNPKVLLVGEIASPEDIKSNRPFVNRSGMFLRTVMAELGITEYALANVTSCLPRDGVVYTPSTEEAEHCRKHVDAFVKQYNPETVILLGRGAYEAILPESYYAGHSVQLRF